MKTHIFSKIVFAILSFCLISLSSAVSSAESILPLSKNRMLVYETSDLDQPGPVFLFMPGIFRGLQMNEDTSKLPEHQKVTFAQHLKDLKIPFVLMNFAEQPASVAATGKERPDFSKMDAQILADEVLALAKHLNLQNAIPVSLSFSAVVVSKLDKSVFPAVIEVAPISTDTDTLDPASLAIYNYYLAWGVFGTPWIEQMLRQHWGAVVSGYSQLYPILNEPEYRERAIQGYMGLTTASKNFDIRKQNFSAGPVRYFVLGESEDANRLKLQKEAVALYEKATQTTGMSVIIPGAGHTVPVEQPKAFVDVLVEIHQGMKK